MRQYLHVLKDVLENGDPDRDTRNWPTTALFDREMVFDLADGFPIVTTKRVAFGFVKAELLWFISGSQDVNDLRKYGCTIWDANADDPHWKVKAEFDGDVGRIYGVQWRKWRKPDGTTIDQLQQLIDGLKTKPYDRRHIVLAWNPGELDQMCLPPCHASFQCFVEKGRLSLAMWQRSCDMFLGVPFNISSYALLLAIVAQLAGLKPGKFYHHLGDTHIYQHPEHLAGVRLQLTREPYPLPQLLLNPEVKRIDDFKMDDIKLVGYQHHPVIKAPMIV